MIKIMDDTIVLEAMMIAEGVAEVNEKQYLAAWQKLVDTGLAWKLQGWFGRRAEQLIDAGLITTAKENDNE